MDKYNIEELLGKIENTRLNNPEFLIGYTSQFPCFHIDKVLYKNPNAKLLMSSETIFRLSNESIKRLQNIMVKTTTVLVEQIFQHLGIITLDDHKYHALGRDIDIEIFDGLEDRILVVDGDDILCSFDC